MALLPRALHGLCSAGHLRFPSQPYAVHGGLHTCTPGALTRASAGRRLFDPGAGICARASLLRWNGLARFRPKPPPCLATLLAFVAAHGLQASRTHTSGARSPPKGEGAFALPSPVDRTHDCRARPPAGWGAPPWQPVALIAPSTHASLKRVCGGARCLQRSPALPQRNPTRLHCAARDTRPRRRPLIVRQSESMHRAVLARACGACWQRPLCAWSNASTRVVPSLEHTLKCMNVRLQSCPWAMATQVAPLALTAHCGSWYTAPLPTYTKRLPLYLPAHPCQWPQDKPRASRAQVGASG